MDYKISQEANNDLEKIWLFTHENWSTQQADRYINLIFNEIEHIALNPETGKDYSHVRKKYFKVRVKSHFIFYKPKKREIEIIRILHQRMDIESRLNE